MVWPPMLRRSCETAQMDDTNDRADLDHVRRRLRDAGGAVLELRAALVAGEPWPLSERWGTEPEADWGPREVLAHVNEMLAYWTEQLEAVLAGDPAVAVPFGRVATDAGRLARIEADRRRPVAALLDGVAAGLDRVGAFAGTLSPADAERRGLHATRGEITVREALDRFLVGHLEEHVEQLRAILAREQA
jgi:hypothetical protein